ncbi:MAG TPA: hypothetical protein VGR62_13475 [Candidatus Binatia bacterium]|jgi:hypothetical protein|nr:hypothetical protein [Candidatus Binatia bacterium]
MRWDGFARSILFAAVAAMATAACLLMAAPLLGGRRVLALWLVALTAAYLSGLVPDRRRGVAAAFGALVAGATLLVIAPGLHEVVLGLAVVLGVGRSVFLYRRRPARAVVVEAVLLVGGLVLVAWLGGPSLHGVVLAVWGFLLVQSGFFLVPGASGRRAFEGAADPFEAAHARALALLAGDPR